MPYLASLEVVIDIQRFINIELLSQGLYYVCLRVEGPLGEVGTPYDLVCSRLPGRDDYRSAPKAEILRDKRVRGRAFNVQYVEQCETMKELCKFAITVDAAQLVGSGGKAGATDLLVVAELHHLAKEKLLKTVTFEYEPTPGAEPVPYPESVQKQLRNAAYSSQRHVDLKYGSTTSTLDLRGHEERLGSGEVRRVRRKEDAVDASTFSKLITKKVPIMSPLTPRLEYLPVVFDGAYFCKVDALACTSLTGITYVPDVKSSSSAASKAPLGTPRSAVYSRGPSLPPSEALSDAGAALVDHNRAEPGTPARLALPPPSEPSGSPATPQQQGQATPQEQTLSTSTVSRNNPALGNTSQLSNGSSDDAKPRRPKDKKERKQQEASERRELYSVLMSYLCFALYRLESWVSSQAPAANADEGPEDDRDATLSLQNLLLYKDECLQRTSHDDLSPPGATPFVDVFQQLERVRQSGRPHLLSTFFAGIDEHDDISVLRQVEAVTRYVMCHRDSAIKRSLAWDDDTTLDGTRNSGAASSDTGRDPMRSPRDTNPLGDSRTGLLFGLSSLIKSLWDERVANTTSHVLQRVDEARAQEAFFHTLRDLAMRNLEVYDPDSEEAIANASEPPLSPRLESPRIDKKRAPEHGFFDYEKRTHVRIRELRPEIDRSSSVIVNKDATDLRQVDLRPHISAGHDLVVFVHGWKGSSADLCLFKNYLAVYLPPNKEYYCVKNMAETPNAPIKDLGETVAKEVADYIEARDLQVERLSFVGHSMGCVVIRSCLMSDAMAPYLPKLHTFMSFAGPHLGIAEHDSAKVGCAIGCLASARWMRNIRDLSLETLFMHTLSSGDRIHMFKHVLMFGSEADQFVGPGSALVVQPPCGGKAQDNRSNADGKGQQKRGKRELVNDMARNLSAASWQCETHRRFIVTFAPHGRKELTSWYDRLIGRSIHICFLVDITFLNLVALLFKDYFL